jgi:cell division protein ZapB
MISEFQDLSDKIDRLAQLTQSLRAENKLWQQANKLLSAENAAFRNQLAQAQQRVEALLAMLPPPAVEAEADDATGDQSGQGDAAPGAAEASEVPR